MFYSMFRCSSCLERWFEIPTKKLFLNMYLLACWHCWRVLYMYLMKLSIAKIDHILILINDYYYLLALQSVCASSSVKLSWNLLIKKTCWWLNMIPQSQLTGLHNIQGRFHRQSYYMI